MPDDVSQCVLLADRHHGLSERICGLLKTRFGTVVMVTDSPSLLESARRLQPDVVVVDLSLTRSSSLRWLDELRVNCPKIKVVVLSVHDEPEVQRAVKAAGADGFVLKRAISTDLLPAIESLLGG
jgi:two-component system response regulator NreC